MIKHLGITHILNISETCECSLLENLSCVKMPIKDENTAEIARLFPDIFAFIHQALTSSPNQNSQSGRSEFQISDSDPAHLLYHSEDVSHIYERLG